jgi:hypothetical protein
MSLISFRNLSAPFRSKIQIGGLIIAALLVLVIRLGASGSSGGQVSASPENQLSDAEDEQLRRSQLTELLMDDPPSEPRRVAGKRQAAESDEVLDELVDGRFDKQQRKKKAEEASGNSFEDIRRSLGIE